MITSHTLPEGTVGIISVGCHVIISAALRARCEMSTGAEPGVYAGERRSIDKRFHIAQY